MECSGSVECLPGRKEPRVKVCGSAELRPWREPRRLESVRPCGLLPDLKDLRVEVAVLAERRTLRSEPVLKFAAPGELLAALKDPPLKERPVAAPLVPAAARPRLAVTWPDIKPTSATMAIKRMYVLKAISHLALSLYIETPIFARL